MFAERLIGEATKGAFVLQAQVEAGTWRRAIEAHPTLAPVGRWLEQQIDLPALLRNIVSWLTNTGASFVQGSIVQLLGVVLTFYLLFYFLRDRRLMLETLRSHSPLSLPEMDRLYSQTADTIHAIIYGTVVVACVQGTLGGLMFWWLSLPTPLLWGLVMGLLAIVPVLGAFVVWIPAAIFLALDGNWEKAIILFLWGGAGRQQHRQPSVSDAGGKPAEASHRSGVYFFGRRSNPVWPGRYHPWSHVGHDHHIAP